MSPAENGGPNILHIMFREIGFNNCYIFCKSSQLKFFPEYNDHVQRFVAHAYFVRVLFRLALIQYYLPEKKWQIGKPSL